MCCWFLKAVGQSGSLHMGSRHTLLAAAAAAAAAAALFEDMHPPPPPVSPDPDSGVCCKLEAKLARNGLFNKAAALVFDEAPVPAVECAGYDTEGGNGLDEGAADIAVAAVVLGVGTFAPPTPTLFSKGDVEVIFLLQVLLFTVMLSVTRISVEEDLDLDLL